MDKEQTKAKTEKQMAEALLWIVKEYGDDFINEDPEGCALIMESFIAGQDSCRPNIGELEKTVSIQDAAIEVISDSVLNLKAQNKELIDKYSTLVQDYSSKFYEQAKEIRELREALNNVILAVAEKDAGASYPRLMKCQSIAIKALKEDKQDG